MERKPPKPKICGICGTEFIPQQMGQKPCSPRCAIEMTNEDKFKQHTKTAKKDRRDAKQNSKSHQKDKAQEAFNKHVRLRDYALPCISCGRHHQGQYHAGHYRSVGAAPHLRFNEDNCHKQCAPCNNHKSGNAVEYRINLIKKIGAERVDALESDNTPRQYRIEDYKAIRTKYNLKCKQLEREIDR